jgi:hypothetical protein
MNIIALNRPGNTWGQASPAQWSKAPQGSS